MTKIEWSDATWNPIRAYNLETGGRGHFCVHVSEGCKHCYAERMQPRFKNPIRYAAQDARKVEIYLDKDILHRPLGWRKPRTVFVCSMTDLFYEAHSAEMLVEVWANMALARRHQFQVLTKRPENAKAFLIRDDFVEAIKEIYDLVAAGTPDVPEWQWPLPNVWMGTSIEGPSHWGRVIHLRDTPAALRFLSIEPLLGGLGTNAEMVRDVDWVICGGESGPKARPMKASWAREIRDRCKLAGVPFFMKQMAKKAPIPGDLMVREWPA